MAASFGHLENLGIKRKRSTVDDEMEHEVFDMQNRVESTSKMFLSLSSSRGTYQSVEYKIGKETMYLPITDGEVMVNVQSIDQLTCEKGTFFMGDENSKYLGSTAGMLLFM